MVGVWVFMGLSVSVCWKCLYKHWDGTALRVTQDGGSPPLPISRCSLEGTIPERPLRKFPWGRNHSPPSPLPVSCCSQGFCWAQASREAPASNGASPRRIYWPTVWNQRLAFPTESQSRGKTGIVFSYVVFGGPDGCPGRGRGRCSVGLTGSAV